jgi:type I restriction enzyme S subunit
MSRGSVLEKLLDGVTVEWKRLGELAEIKRGTSITQKDVTPGEIPVIAGGRTPAYFHNVSNRTGQTIVIAGSGNAGFVSWWEQPIFVSDAFTVKPFGSLLSKYCFYWLHSKQKQLYEMKSGGGVPHVYPRDVAPLEIPIPCPDNPKKSLEIQAEIVRILDAFTTYTTELTAELTTELTARKKQYTYYRDQLLNFEGKDVEWKTLQEIFITRNGYTPSTNDNSYWTDGTISWFRMEDIRENGQILGDSLQKITKKAVKAGKLFPANSILVATSATIGEHALITVPHLSNQRFTSLAIKQEFVERLDIKFVFYYCFILDDWCRKNTTTSSFASVDMNGFKKFKFPIPSIEVQRDIVRILDKFDALTNSLTEGLPREIELRQKQYEYYRDKLFTFIEAGHE